VNVRDLAPFRSFVRMCAARTAQLLNLSSLAADCGITHNTAKAWLSVLEASYLVHLLPPWHRNLGKRLVKTPKLYFIDTGLAAALAQVRSARELAIHPMRGPLFETWVVAELLKARLNAGLAPDLYFWRDSNGTEIDVVVERAGRLRALEVKSGRTVAADWFGPLERLARTTPTVGALIYGGDAGQPRRENPVYGWRDVSAAARHLLA